MNNINTASLLLAVLAILVSIAAFVLDDHPNPKTRRWKIALGIIFFFFAVLLGAYGVAGFVVSPPTMSVVTPTDAAPIATATTAPTMDVPNPVYVYVLLQAGWGTQQYAGKEIGAIELRFSDGTAIRQLTITDETQQTTGQMDPCIHLLAVTILHFQEPTS